MKICRFNGGRLGVVQDAWVLDVTSVLDLLGWTAVLAVLAAVAYRRPGRLLAHRKDATAPTGAHPPVRAGADTLGG